MCMCMCMFCKCLFWFFFFLGGEGEYGGFTDCGLVSLCRLIDIQRNRLIFGEV